MIMILNVIITDYDNKTKLNDFSIIPTGDNLT